MTLDNLTGDIISIVASVIAFSYVLGIWRMVRAPSRLALLVAMLYMVTTRALILVTEATAPLSWVPSHRSLIIVPQYILFAVAFGMTYYELRGFRFEVPKNQEDLDTQTKHLLQMEALRMSTTPTTGNRKKTDKPTPETDDCAS
jgi:hypothetical protein